MTKKGRPIKNGCDFYPHYTTMRNHRKVKALRTKFGAVLGYAFWAMFLEYLTEQDGNELEDSTIELEMFAGELGVTAIEIREMINYCYTIELLFKKDGFICSDSLSEWLSPVYDKRQRAKEKSATRKRRENGSFDSNSNVIGIVSTEITNNTPISAETNPHSIVEYSIEKKELSDLQIFDKFRKLYGGIKKSNETEFKNFQKKHKDWEEVLPHLEPIIKKQIEHRRRKELKKEFVPEWKHLQTWINQRCWEEELSLPDGISPDGRFNPNGNGYAIDPQAYIHGTPPKGKYVGKPKIDQ